VASPYADLDRPPLGAAALRGALVRDRSLWREIRVLPETASTNEDVGAAARTGGAEGLVIVAESQTAGRGRLGRAWIAPPRSGLTFSVLLRPVTAPSTWGWLPLLTGVALADAVAKHSAVPARLKWPNDLLAADGRKLAGILAEVVPGPAGTAVVVGVGLNVTTRPEELTGLPAATSLALQGAVVTDRGSLFRALLRSLEATYAGWQAAGGAPLASYPAACETIGATVRLTPPGGGEVIGLATGVDSDGRLQVQAADGAQRVFSAGDVEHLR
jgi:BirA family transcriptional regulator, biotin operon repressor / biotin---[acetyl-CoA-carboxylase] ligase